MPINDAAADACGDAISAAIRAMTVQNRLDPAKVWETIIRTLYASIRTNAVVNVTSVSGVTAGGGTSGPGSGTVS